MSRRNFLEINVLGDAEMWLVLLVGNPWKLGRGGDEVSIPRCLGEGAQLQEGITSDTLPPPPHPNSFGPRQ